VAQDTIETKDGARYLAGDKYIMDKYGLTYDQLVKLKVEGIQKNWP